MVKGLDIFKNHFSNFQDKYVLIGGTACMVIMQEVGISFRATKDLDIVLHVEALDKDFVAAFWKFVKAGGYQIQEKSTGKPILYRFDSPTNKDFPAKLELSSHTLDGVKLENRRNFTPISLSDTHVSLSAILIEDNYYQFILSGKKESNGLSLVGAEHLIPLKAKAWLNLTNKKENGEKIDTKDIRKHKNDILRLHQLLSIDNNITLPLPIKRDLREFFQRNEKDPIDLKTLDIKHTTYEKALNNLKEIFNITPLPSLGEALTKTRGDELVQSVMEILAVDANVIRNSFNGYHPLQLLIKADLDPHKKLELVKYFTDLGADIHSADNSGLTPYQVAISEEDNSISNLLRSKGARPMSPPGTGYVQHYAMYHEIPLP